MRKYLKSRYVLPAAMLPAMMAVASSCAAGGHNGNEIPFSVAELFFELNHTDGDLGIHGMIDGDAWEQLNITGPDENEMLDIDVSSNLQLQGMTEIFFESAEPAFESDDADEVTLPPEEFFARFPEGTYEIEGLTIEGEDMESETEVTHVMPAPPVVYVNGAPAAEDCDAEDLPEVDFDEAVTLSWDPVTHSHPDIGSPNNTKLNGQNKVVNYEVVVEIDETPYRTSAILPPDVTEYQVAQEILALGDEIKFEVLVREASYNQTAVESCFVEADGG
ncbi:MAG: hypothetical protein ABFS23_05965 [Pseudomonadota bacterium]